VRYGNLVYFFGEEPAFIIFFNDRLNLADTWSRAPFFSAQTFA